MLFRMYTDGGFRQQQNIGAWCYTIFDDNGMVDQASGVLEGITNNVAEYNALINGLKSLNSINAKRVVIVSDSQLLIRQMQGKWQVKNERLRVLHGYAVELCKQIDEVVFEWKPRDNVYVSMCDKKCNDTMDAMT